MSKNSISDLKTVNLQIQSGPLTAIMIGLDIPDIHTADAFIAEVAETFKLQRMSSPPETRGLLFTIIGELPASQFVRRWKELVDSDPILSVFMSQMRIADVMRGSPSGQPLENVSLLQKPLTH
jgi:hypothetical protein